MNPSLGVIAEPLTPHSNHHTVPSQIRHHEAENAKLLVRQAFPEGADAHRLTRYDIPWE
jgi:hypothetical protein